MIKKFISYSIFILSISLQAQVDSSHWETTFYVHHPSGWIDSITIGCDINGNVGFQTGLDIIDTSFLPPVSIKTYDSLIEQQFGFSNCINLQTDIRKFDSINDIEYLTYALVDTPFIFPNNTFKISWDTSSFRYKNSFYELTDISISAIEGYIYSIDGKKVNLYSQYILPNGEKEHWFFKPFEAKLIPDNIVYECQQNEDIIILNIVVQFNKPIYLDLHEIKEKSFEVYPNPASQILKINFPDENIKIIRLIDIQGRVIFNLQSFNKQEQLHLNDLLRGIYFLHIFSEGRLIKRKVLIQ